MNRLELLASQINGQKTLEKVEIKVCPNTNIGYLILNSPKDLNILSEKMVEEVCWGLGKLENDSSVNAIVVKSSNSKFFCAGADIKRFLKQDYEYYIRNEIFHVLDTSFRSTKKPIIAAVNGKALGGGFELALLCDIIIASENSYFALPQVNLGLMPGIGGTQRLTKIVGEKLALRHILTADGFDAKRAYELNICDLVKADSFDQNVTNIVKKITQKAVSTMMIAKRAVKFASQSNLTQGLDFQKSTFYPMLATKAAKQGISAFTEKRKPNFKGL